MGSAFRLSKEEDTTYCLICQESIRTDFLHDHIQMHSGVNPAACKNCLKEFDSSEILRKHYLDCKFRKKGEYKCLLCSNIESCSEDLMYHFINLHSSRLNWSLKSMIDAIFLKGASEQEIDEQVVDNSFDLNSIYETKLDLTDTNSSDTSKASVKKEKVEDAPTESSYLQALISKRKGYIEKITELVRKNSKKGVSFDFIEAYFNTKLESEHFKNSLNSYTEAALLHGKIWKANKDGVEVFYPCLEKTPEKTNRKKKCGTCESCVRPDCKICRYCLDKPKFGGPNLLKRPCLKRKCDNLKSTRKPSVDRRKLPSFDKIETFQLGFQIKTFSIRIKRLADEEKKEEIQVTQNIANQKLQLALKQNIDSILSEATKIFHQEDISTEDTVTQSTRVPIVPSENRGKLSLFSEAEDIEEYDFDNPENKSSKEMKEHVDVDTDQTEVGNFLEDRRKTAIENDENIDTKRLENIEESNKVDDVKSTFESPMTDKTTGDSVTEDNEAPINEQSLSVNELPSFQGYESNSSENILEDNPDHPWASPSPGKDNVSFSPHTTLNLSPGNLDIERQDMEKLSSLEFDIENHSLTFTEPVKGNKSSMSDKVFLTEDEDSEDNTNVEIKQQIDDILKNTTCVDDDTKEEDEQLFSNRKSVREDICLTNLTSVDDFCELDDIPQDDLLDISVDDSDASDKILQEKKQEDVVENTTIEEEIRNTTSDDAIISTEFLQTENSTKEEEYENTKNLNEALVPEDKIDTTEKLDELSKELTSTKNDIKSTEQYETNENPVDVLYNADPVGVQKNLGNLDKQSNVDFDDLKIKSKSPESSTVACSSLVHSKKKIQRKIPIYRMLSDSNKVQKETSKEENYLEFDDISNRHDTSEKDQRLVDIPDVQKVSKIQGKKSGCIVSKAETSTTRKFFQRKKFGSMNTKFTSRQIPASSLTFEDDDPFAIDNDIQKERVLKQNSKVDEDFKKIKLTKKEKHLIKTSEELGKKVTRSLIKVNNSLEEKVQAEISAEKEEIKAGLRKYKEKQEELKSLEGKMHMNSYLDDEKRTNSPLICLKDDELPKTEKLQETSKTRSDVEDGKADVIQSKQNPQGTEKDLQNDQPISNTHLKTIKNCEESLKNKNNDNTCPINLESKPKGKRGRPKKRPMLSTEKEENVGKNPKLESSSIGNESNDPERGINSNEESNIDKQDDKVDDIQLMESSKAEEQETPARMQLPKQEDILPLIAVKRKRGRPKRQPTDILKKIKTENDTEEQSLKKMENIAEFSSEKTIKNKENNVNENEINSRPTEHSSTSRLNNQPEEREEPNKSTLHETSKNYGSKTHESDYIDNNIDLIKEIQQESPSSSETNLNVSMKKNLCKPIVKNATPTGKKRGRPRKSILVAESAIMQLKESVTDNKHTNENDAFNEKAKDTPNLSENDSHSKPKFTGGRKSKRSLDKSDHDEVGGEKEVKPDDFEGLVIDAVEQINNASGSDRKYIRKFIIQTKSINIPLKLVCLCLESAAVAGRLKQIERKGTSFYVIQSSQVEQPGDASKLDDPYAFDLLNKSDKQRNESGLAAPYIDTESKGIRCIEEELEMGKEKDEQEADKKSDEDKKICDDLLEEKQDPTCPVCFKMLLNAEKMKLHIRECHGSEETKKCGENQENPLKLTIHLSSEKKKIRIKCKTEEQ